MDPVMVERVMESVRDQFFRSDPKLTANVVHTCIGPEVQIRGLETVSPYGSWVDGHRHLASG